MKDHRQVARRACYFSQTGFPLSVRRVATNAGQGPSHPHDLTGQKHRHDFCELVMVSCGAALQWIEGQDFPVTAGDVFFLQGNQRHYFHHCENLSLVNIMYDPVLAGLPESELRRMPGYCALFLLEPACRRTRRVESRLHLGRVPLARAEQMADDIDREMKEAQPGFEAAVRAKLTELIIFLSRCYTAADTIEGQALLRVGSVIGALEENFSREWTLDELERIACMSRSHLMRVFRRATGQTPIGYLIRLRIQKAMELLRTTEIPITDIALDVGFNDSNYFSRQFRRIASVTPSDFRKNAARW